MHRVYRSPSLCPAIRAMTAALEPADAAPFADDLASLFASNAPDVCPG
jgi:hypothetical protein